MTKTSSRYKSGLIPRKGIVLPRRKVPSTHRRDPSEVTNQEPAKEVPAEEVPAEEVPAEEVPAEKGTGKRKGPAVGEPRVRKRL